jgi:hypothetical protein
MFDHDRGRGDTSHRAQAVGGWLAVVGGLGYFVLLLLHGDLPDETTATALEHIAARPEWGLLKWLLIACVFCWVGAFALLVQSMQAERSRILGRLATAALMVGATLVLVEYSILGYGLKNVANAWTAAPDAERGELLLVGDVLIQITGGLFLNFISWLIGLPFLLMGLAVSLDGRFPGVVGWVAVVGGLGAFVSGAGRFLDLFAVPFPVLYGGFIVPLVLWLAAVGLLLIRRSRRDAGEARAQAA